MTQAIKVAVITGSASGLGRALAKEYFSMGWHLALVDVNKEGLVSLHHDLNSDPSVSIHAVDISTEERVIDVRKEILTKHGRVDMLINNAGISISQPFTQIEHRDFDQLMKVNFWGMVFCTRHFIADLKQPGSRIVNIISGFAQIGFPGKTAYCASKAATMGFSHALRTELPSHIKICLVVPPPIHTGLVKNGKHISPEKQRNEDRYLEKNGMPVTLVAKKIAEGIKRGKFRIIIGRRMYWADLAARLFPGMVNNVIRRKKKKIDFY